MKFPVLRNTTSNRIVIRQVRNFVVDAGGTIKVHPTTVSHPAVVPYLKQRQLVVVTDVVASEPTVVAPSAPPEPKPVVVEKVVEPPPVVEPKVQEESPTEATAQDEEPVVVDLRALYLSAPGIGEENIDAVIEKCPTMKQLAEASKSALVGCGVSKSDISSLHRWAKEQA